MGIKCGQLFLSRRGTAGFRRGNVGTGVGIVAYRQVGRTGFTPLVLNVGTRST